MILAFQKKKQQIILFFIFFFFLNPVLWLFIQGYWGTGDGDCKGYHGTTHLDVYHDPSASITLDGVDNEAFWHVSGKNNSIQVPVASDIQGSDFFILYVDMVFVRSNTHIYILARWLDYSLKSNWDQFSICWNINMENYTAGLFQGMKTESYGGGDVDTWQWGYRLGKANGSSYDGYDACFGDTGWYDRTSELSQVETGMIYGNNHYQIEIARPLTTGEIYDVQFIENKPYGFSIGILDNSYGTGEGEDHAISWTYFLHFSGLLLFISGYEISIILFTSITLIGVFIGWTSKKVKN